MKVTEVEKDEREFQDKLTEIFGTVEICGMKYDSGYALRELDPTAFRCALSDEPIRYQCGECGEDFDDEDTAEECCKTIETEA